MDDNIKVLGLDDFDPVEEKRIIELASEYYDKVKRSKAALLVLHGKKHEHDGGKSKYSFHARLEGVGALVEVRDDDWDLSRALHRTLRKLENAVQKKYKTKGKRV